MTSRTAPPAPVQSRDVSDALVAFAAALGRRRKARLGRLATKPPLDRRNDSVTDSPS